MDLKLYILIGVLSLSNYSKAQTLDGLQQQFDQSQQLKEYFFGFSLYDLDNNEFVFEQNQNNYFTPASNTKVFTLYESLTHLGDSILGMEYMISGDSLFFWGTGDPTFLHPKLDNRRVYDFLLNSNKELVYVPQQTQEPYYREGWAIEDYDYYYQPDVAVFPIYGNVVRFGVVRGKVRVQPAYFEGCVEVEQNQGRVRISRELKENKYHISGVSDNLVNSEKPFIYSDSLFVRLLSDTLGRNINLVNRDKPLELQKLYSVPKSEVLREMMLPSDNFLAEHLSMSIAYQLYGEFRTRDAREQMQKQHYSLLTDRIQLRDGCGLSAYNKITPRSMVELLGQIYSSNEATDSYRYYFPTGGLEGTLKGVYPMDQGVPFVWAKTGTIHAVHCQSGFIQTRSGRNFAFSFLNNNYFGSSVPVRNEMVRIMTYIRQNF